VTSGGAAALLQNGTTMISVANRVIAIGYQSVIAVRRVKAQSRRGEASAFYKATTLKRKPEIFYDRSTVGRNFDANCATLRNAMRKQNYRITWRQQRYAKQWNAAQLVRLELQISCSSQPSYAGAARYESSFNEFIKSSSYPFRASRCKRD